jgi:hypothetical protein
MLNIVIEFLKTLVKNSKVLSLARPVSLKNPPPTVSEEHSASIFMVEA